MSIHATILAIGQVLNGQRFSLQSEKQTQQQIEDIFKEKGIPYQREVRLSDRDVIDFMVDGVGIEVKLKGGRKAVFSQLSRYAQHDCITALYLVTNRSIQLPKYINEKWTYIHNLGKSWL